VAARLPVEQANPISTWVPVFRRRANDVVPGGRAIVFIERIVADLFSRQTRPGFEGWGNEHGKFDERPALVGAD
jgi:hypothetical protein